MGQPQTDEKKYSIAQWLALEETEGIRYEYHFGEIYAMAGGTVNYTRISANTFYELENHLRETGKDCDAFPSDLKIEINDNNRYVYPDTVVVCGDTKESDEVTGAVTNPLIVVEVVSESSSAYDYGAKFRYYRRLPSVGEYLILEQDDYIATLYRRIGDGDIFGRHEFEGKSAQLELVSIGLTIELAKLYRKVIFPANH